MRLHRCAFELILKTLNNSVFGSNDRLPPTPATNVTGHGAELTRPSDGIFTGYLLQITTEKTTTVPRGTATCPVRKAYDAAGNAGTSVGITVKK